MDKMLVLKHLLLLVLAVIVPVMSRLNSVTVLSYRGARKTKNGPVMCALEPANETTQSCSQQDCSLKCGRDGTCIGINIKNAVTCELYKYKPKLTSLVSGCMFYQVDSISNFLTLQRLLMCETFRHCMILVNSILLPIETEM